MCTRVQSSSAFRTTKATTSTPDQKSLAIRKKNVLTRDDSGVFSASPSPLTPSHSAVFPPPPLTATSPSSTAIGAMSKATQGASNSRDEDPSPLGLGRPTFPPTAEQHRGHPIADNGYHGVQVCVAMARHGLQCTCTCVCLHSYTCIQLALRVCAPSWIPYVHTRRSMLLRARRYTHVKESVLTTSSKFCPQKAVGPNQCKII